MSKSLRDADIAARRSAGEGIGAIAAVHGMKTGAVRMVLSRAGLHKNHEPVSPDACSLILDMWAADKSADEIGTTVGIISDRVHCVVHRFRKIGDARAARRIAAPDFPARQSVYRSRPDASDMRDEVLHYWGSGYKGTEISQCVDIGISYVHSIIAKARAAGDVRAERRRAA